MWCEKKPNIGHLPVFGCVAYAYVPDCERQRLDKKARKLRFVGYCKPPKATDCMMKTQEEYSRVEMSFSMKQILQSRHPWPRKGKKKRF